METGQTWERPYDGAFETRMRQMVEKRMELDKMHSTNRGTGHIARMVMGTGGWIANTIGTGQKFNEWTQELIPVSHAIARCPIPILSLTIGPIPL